MTTQRTTWMGRVIAPIAICLALPAAGSVTFDWTIVGDPGNVPDTLVMDKGPAADFTTGYGTVDYVYRISKFNVTNSQYVAFLNAVDPAGSNALRVFNTKMSDGNANPAGLAYTGGISRNLDAATGSRYSAKTGQENFPAIWINWASGARFVNWLANGQGPAGTESGVYDMAAIPSNNSFATPPPRAAGAPIFLPSEDEYYKAAYYDPAKNGGIGGYWQYGTRSDTPPASVVPPGSANAANIGAGTDGQSGGTLATTMATTGAPFNQAVNYLTAVGSYTSATSAYGLYDVEGLVYNWTEATRTSFGNQLPIYRGGSWRYNEGASGAAHRNVYSGAGAASYAWFGFRVAGLAPEPPSSITIDVTSGTQTQGQAGYALLTPAEALTVTKTGAGTLVFDAPNTYSGETIISAGVLALTGSGSIASSELVRIEVGGRLDVMGLPGGLSAAAGQTIAGDGTIVGSVRFGAGSTLSPGVGGGQAASVAVAVVPEPPMLAWCAVLTPMVAAACRRQFRCRTSATPSRSSPPSCGD